MYYIIYLFCWALFVVAVLCFILENYVNLKKILRRLTLIGS